ncbi:hypothetical protein [Endozoicomonas sp. SCSIO W0465]|uniref:hypothetical protein n=1 Tax=Endozoicomonas sp. SCSIO W0465 TaxID=2918516 RepID=UPI00207596CB|nr:hypothetical protein [Endozoicomonas sp. SCSIO W0465]USE33797.1 hypothetical protein MJO57_16590 [Endozoicomonas sp. SCSIO W0465]
MKTILLGVLMMKITMVKKIMADGHLCKKCREVQERLESSGYINRIDQFVTAIDDDPGSTGTLLAEMYQVDKAPFFIVEEGGSEPVIYTVYFKLVKEVLERAA